MDAIEATPLRARLRLQSWALRCALAGCPWRVVLPVGVEPGAARRCLEHAGWREDPEGGFICHLHGGGPCDA